MAILSWGEYWGILLSPASKQPSDGRKKATRTGKTSTVKRTTEVTIPRETLIRRVVDARRAGMVVLMARAVGGGLVTLLLSSAAMLVLVMFHIVFDSVWVTTPLSVALAMLFNYAIDIEICQDIPIGDYKVLWEVFDKSQWANRSQWLRFGDIN